MVKSAKFMDLHVELKKVLAEHPVSKIVMMETWGDYFQISFEDREKLLTLPTKVEFLPHQKEFIRIRYRPIDTNKIVKIWRNMWMSWFKARDNNLLVEMWVHKPVPMDEIHGSKINNTAEKGEPILNMTFENFEEWHGGFIRTLQRMIEKEKLNINIRFLEELHHGDDMTKLYRKDGMMPNIHGPLGERWAEEVAKFFGNDKKGPGNGIVKHGKCPWEETFGGMARLAGVNPESFQPEMNPGVCVAIVEIWKKKWLQAKKGNMTPEVHEEDNRSGHEIGSYQSVQPQTNENHVRGQQNTYELLPVYEQPSTSQGAPPSNVRERDLWEDHLKPTGLDNMFKSPSKTPPKGKKRKICATSPARKTPLTPGKSLPLF